MFQSTQRLKRTKEISKVFKLGRSYFLAGLGIKALENTSSFTRATVFVSKKVSKRAVIRNRVKRQIREILKAATKDTKACDLIVICQPAVVNMEFAELEKAIKQIIAKLKL